GDAACITDLIRNTCPPACPAHQPQVLEYRYYSKGVDPVSETTVRPARRPTKPGGKRTANRFAKLAGGDATPESDLSPAVDDHPDASDGLIAGMSAVAVDEAHHVVEIAVSEVAPHPFNDNAR